MARPRLLYCSDFSGGLNKKSSDVNIRAIPSNEGGAEVLDCENVEFGKFGSIVKVNGYTRYAATPVPNAASISGMVDYKNSLGVTKRIVTAGTAIYTLGTDGTWTELYNSLTATDRVYFSTFADYLVITNGVNSPLKYDGTTVSALSNWTSIEASAVPTYSTVWKNRLWFAHSPSKPYRIWHSAAGDPEGWTASAGANAIDVNINDGQFVTAIHPFSDALIVYKENSIHRVQGDTNSDFVIKPVFTGMGCVSHASVVNIGNFDQLFMTDRGEIASLRTSDTYGDFVTRLLTVKVMPIVQDMNLSELDKAFAINHRQKSQAWWMFPIGSSSLNNRVLILDYESGAWTVKRGFSGTAGFESAGLPYIADGDGYVNKHDFGGNYNGGVIQAYVQTAWYFANDAVFNKRVRSLDMLLGATGAFTLDCTAYWNFNQLNLERSLEFSMAPVTNAALWGTALWGTALWTEPHNRMARQVGDIGQGKALSLKFQNNNANEPFEIVKLSLSYQDRGFRYGSPFP